MKRKENWKNIISYKNVYINQSKLTYAFLYSNDCEFLSNDCETYILLKVIEKFRLIMLSITDKLGVRHWCNY